MGRIKSLDKARKKQTRRTVAKRIILSALLVTALFFAYLQRIEISNIGFALWIEEKVSTQMATNKFPVELPKGVDKHIISIGPRIGVTQNNGVSVYSGVGEWINDIRTSCQNPVAISNSKRIVTYDLGAYALRQDMGENMLYQRTYSYPIYSVALSVGNKMAVTTGEARYLSKVQVYSNNFDEIFSWSSSETNVIATALNDNSLVTAGAATKEGMLYSDVTWLSLKTDEPKCIVTLEDELVFNLQFISDDKILALTNKSAVIISKNGQIVAKTELGQNLGSFLVDKKGNLWITLGNYSATRRAEVVGFDISLKEFARIPVDFQIMSLLAYGDNIVTYCGDHANVYSSKGELLKSLKTTDGISATIIGNYLYYVTQSSLNRISLS